METIYIASENKHKIEEFQKLLAPLECNVLGLPSGIPSAVEDGLTFLENARKKATHYSKYVNGYTLADDSGIVVHALGGQPGVFSARYAGVHGNDKANNEKLIHELANVQSEDRSGEFVCALVLYDGYNGKEIAVEGRVPGLVLDELRGQEGFGYDPLFFVPELKKTFAEMTIDEKNKYSHRARAVQALIQVWKEYKDADLRSE